MGQGEITKYTADYISIIVTKNRCYSIGQISDYLISISQLYFMLV